MRLHHTTAVVSAVIGGLLLTACAQAPVQLAPKIIVINRSGQQLTELRYRPCNAPTEIWQTFESGALGAGQGIQLDFPLPCSDLSALYASGRVAGQQSNVKENYPFRWDIY